MILLREPVTITSGFGERRDPFNHRKGQFHPGIDVENDEGEGAAVHVILPGFVVKAGYSQAGFGWRVLVDHGDGYASLYGHMRDITVARGQRVPQGEIIGHVGMTGLATGPHLHLEVHRREKTRVVLLDPAEVIAVIVKKGSL